MSVVRFQISVECEQLERIATAVERIAAALKRPPMPGLFSFSANRKGHGMLNFSIVGLPAPGASDVVSRELSIQIGAAEPDVKSVALEASEVTGFSGGDNETVTVSLTDIDDAGNRSEPRVQSFTLVDNIAPPQPGEFGLRIDSES